MIWDVLPPLLFAATALIYALIGLSKARRGKSAAMDISLCALFICVAALHAAT